MDPFVEGRERPAAGLSLSNKHSNLVDLAPLGMDNPGAIFLPTDEPRGLIEATLRKD